MKVWLSLLLFSLSALPCDEYLQIHEDLECKRSHYPKSYGYKYCTKFRSEINDQLSPQGLTWSKKTEKCLINKLSQKLVNDRVSRCSKVKKIAYSQHPGCYIESGFCELDKSDIDIISQSINNKFSVSFFSQAIYMYLRCRFKNKKFKARN